jgi:hypothetical protein
VPWDEQAILLEGLQAEAPWMSRTAMVKKPVDPFANAFHEAIDVALDQLGVTPDQTVEVSELPDPNVVFAHLVGGQDG